AIGIRNKMLDRMSMFSLGDYCYDQNGGIRNSAVVPNRKDRGAGSLGGDGEVLIIITGLKCDSAGLNDGGVGVVDRHGDRRNTAANGLAAHNAYGPGAAGRNRNIVRI